ncbi:MAG: CXXX repeat peptide maturase [Muribaculaceae bacterium]|nr:CXXX repeat peptide maturase [Muribaculaceae bacterium]MBR0025336.1 CXXX repeat peptide maturase [Muribaculaceae bacterium]
MLQYIVILLDDTSTSFCHYQVVKTESSLISIDTLKQAIRFAMIENLTIQFVYPNYELPNDYNNVIESIDHIKIKPFTAQCNDADVVVLDNLELKDFNLNSNVIYVIRNSTDYIISHQNEIKKMLESGARVNIVATDIEQITDSVMESYRDFINILSDDLVSLYAKGLSPQTNILTDRLLLDNMNNCGAGDSTITLAPDSKFYICPAFYQERLGNVGNLKSGVKIPNSQLYKIKYAPICSHCDAFQCKRCIWLNKKMTLEVNTPSREQCVMAHYERNASRNLLQKVRKYGDFLPGKEISEIDYLDPFDVVQQKS